MTEVEALAMSAETFQSCINDEGLLLLVSRQTNAILVGPLATPHPHWQWQMGQMLQ